MDGQTDKHKVMWHSPGPKGSKTWGPLWKGEKVLKGMWQPGQQTLSQIADLISPSPDIQGRSKGENNRKSYKWTLGEADVWPTSDKWGGKSVRCWTCLFCASVYPSLPSSFPYSFPSFSFLTSLFSSLFSFYPFSLFLLKEKCALKNSNFLMAELEKEQKEFACVLSNWAS